MIGIVFSLDYEIFGDGSGNLEDLIIKPTNKFLRILEEHNGKGTIFAETAELISMKKHKIFQKNISLIEKQLIKAHENGHDIQLHIHSWWKDAKYKKGNWVLNYKNSALGKLPVDLIYEFIKNCKDYLKEVFANSSRPYKCRAFRAGSWAAVPTKNLFEALSALGILIDSSVIKWGKLNTKYAKFDYSKAPSNIHPWFFKNSDIIKVDKSNTNLRDRCLEIPIYTEKKSILSFVTMKRLKLRNKVKSALMEANDKDKSNFFNKAAYYLNFITGKRSKMLDFCKCNLKEMKKMMKNIIKENREGEYLPVVAIGHSKDFIYCDDFIDFLKHIKQEYKDSVEIVTLSDAVDKYLYNLSKKKEN